MNFIDKKGYKTAFKTTSLFGGVQILTVIVAVLKAKLISVWIGPAGFGIMSLFNTVVALFSSVTSLGVQNSAVRDIANANAEKDKRYLHQLIKAINRWIIGTSLIGMFVTILFSSLLSKYTFGDTAYIYSYMLLSAVVFFTGMFNGHYALLQGLQQLKLLVKANIYGAVVSLVCSIPFFYFGRESGIVWALISSTGSMTLVSYIYVRKIKIPDLKQNYKETVKLGISTVRLGIALAASGVSVMFVEFILKTYIGQSGGLGDVGLYQAGWSLNASYLGVVFMAMAKDYFPRLSRISKENVLIREAMNEQGEISLLILAPMIIVLIFLLPYLIPLFYSKEFLPIVEMTNWLLIGSLIKAGSWAISFIFLAKGAAQLYLVNELGLNMILLPLYVLSYSIFGLTGIGYAFCFGYTLYFIWVLFVALKKYQVKYSYGYWKLFFVLFFLSLIYPSINLYMDKDISFFVGLSVCVLVVVYAVYELDRRVDFIKFIRGKIK